MKTSAVVRLGNEILNHVNDKSLSNMMTRYSFDNNLDVLVLNENGDVIATENSFNYSRHTRMIPPNQINDIRDKLKLSKSKSVHYIEGNKDRQFIAYLASFQNQDGDTNYLYINSPLPPTDATVDILKNQFIIITIIVLVELFLWRK